MTTKLTYFSAPWCQPCKTFSPVVLQVAAVRGLTVTRIDVDADSRAAAVAGVRSVPTVIAYDDDGRELGRTGRLASKPFAEWLDPLV